ncbi:unnamed protein product [Kluyveromyces dobzhanskii CBS 2104]|uniref:WGS project CCBQ000000000 data, contig 00046 n=1 Tax=Kluyveromyces dobzhanskii CBS 2104 TaxID=1427455 RepID=A0A0A8L9F5_9SACH|nr:unnamed protein product [Kluyveromyces dobzhanskii CBS 2104]
MRAAQVLWKNGTSKAVLMKGLLSAAKNSAAAPEANTQWFGPSTKFLVYRTYNPSLGKDDFQSLVSMPNDPVKQRYLTNSFDVFRYRDPQYFTFLDRYILKFSSSHILKDYLAASRMGFLDDRTVKFSAKDMDSLQDSYATYYRNLLNASKSGAAYKNEVHSPVPRDMSVNWSRLQRIENKSLLVWNLPEQWDHLTVYRKFWWYDIHHCFPLLVNRERNTSLTFMYFNNVRDACLFKNNFHGALLMENRLLVEKL